MDDIMLGNTPDSTAERDAVHVAIAAMIAAERLEPGQRVGFHDNGGATDAISAGLTVGIVDPFLYGPVEKGERFWMLLLPGTVTGMRHHWIHPQFVKSDQPTTERDDGKEVAMEVAALCGKTYDALMDDADSFVGNSGDEDWDNYIIDNSQRYDSVPQEMWKRFWAHYERATGKRGPAYKGAPYSCAC